MTLKNLALGLVLGGAVLTFGACNGDTDDAADGECALTDAGAPDPADPDCYCPDNSLVPAGGDCECDTGDADDPDCEFCDYPENADDPECSDEPQKDPFQPRLLSVDGLVAYDAEADAFRAWTSQSGAVPSYITLEMRDARYDTTQNNNFRCGLILVPTAETTDAEFSSFDYELGTGSGNQTFNHLMFRIESGGYEVVDNPDDGATGGRVPGCIEVQNDPRRGFPETFAAGSVEDWTNEYNWGIGFGNLANRINTEIDGFPADNGFKTLRDEGFVAGGTSQIFNSLTGDEAFDFSLPGNVALAYEVDGDFAPVQQGEELVRIPADQMQSTSDGLRPESGLYEVIAFFIFQFS
jgi:hypothetical protein